MGGGTEVASSRAQSTTSFAATQLLLAIPVLSIAAPLHAQTVCPDPWTLEETLRLGSVDGDVTLTSVNALAIGPDGNIWLTQGPAVSVFSPEGRPVRTFGRAGQGPGEFMVTTWDLGWKGDSLWVLDYGGMHMFAPDESFAYAARFATVVPEDGSVYTPGTPLADGTVLPEVQLRGSILEAYHEASQLPLLRLSSAGDIVDTIALVRMPRELAIERMEWHSHPLSMNAGESRLPGVALAHDGASVIVVSTQAEPGDPATFGLTRVAISGDTMWAREVAYDPVPLSRGEAEELRGSFADRMSGANREGPMRPSPIVIEERRREAAEAISFPDFHPPVRDVRAGHDGTIWLLREMRADRTDRWEVYDERGNLEGLVDVTEGMTPAYRWQQRLEILRVAREEIWAETRDELGVPYVIRFAVRRPC